LANASSFHAVKKRFARLGKGGLNRSMLDPTPCCRSFRFQTGAIRAGRGNRQAARRRRGLVTVARFGDARRKINRTETDPHHGLG
jgi:hypothetical protein